MTWEDPGKVKSLLRHSCSLVPSLLALTLLSCVLHYGSKVAPCPPSADISLLHQTGCSPRVGVKHTSGPLHRLSLLPGDFPLHILTWLSPSQGCEASLPRVTFLVGLAWPPYLKLLPTLPTLLCLTFSHSSHPHLTPIHFSHSPCYDLTLPARPSAPGAQEVLSVL